MDGLYGKKILKLMISGYPYLWKPAISMMDVSGYPVPARLWLRKAGIS